MERDTVKNSIFKKVTYANEYYFSEHFDNIWKNGTSKILKEEVICNCSLELPLLEKGDKFYIEENDTLVTIESVFRTSKDNVLYMVTPDYVDDSEEEMNMSLDKAKQLQTEYEEKRKKEFEETNKIKYAKEKPVYRLFHKYEDYDYTKR